MSRLVILLLFSLVLSWGSTYAQSTAIQPKLQLFVQLPERSGLNLRLPSPVAQLSWLCRQELAVERKLPVGLWMKLGDPAEPPVAWPRPPAYMRMKLLRF